MDFTTQKICVVGDIMLDRYLRGCCARISPEAPVPVVAVDTVEESLGGAANTAANLAAMGCQVRLVGAIGYEESVVDHSLFRLAEDAGIVPIYYRCATCTTTKSRVVAGRHQVARFDRDGAAVGLTPENVLKAVAGCDAVILSDYGKGVVTREVCQALVQADSIPVFVDPKDGDWGKYAGVYCIKPNWVELERACGRDIKSAELPAVLPRVSERYGFPVILVTRGGDGMSLWSQNWKEPFDVPPHRQQDVFDVSGAGDTAMAAFVAAQNLGLHRATMFANWAAGVVVSRRGTATLTKEDLAGYF